MSLITCLISKAIVRSGYAEKCNRARQQGRDPSVTILAYHRIGNRLSDQGELDNKIISASPAAFNWQLAYIKRCFTVLSFDELIEASLTGKALPPNAAVITFDDGYRDNYDLAYPILQRHHLPATIFLISGLIGTTRVMWWDEVARLIERSKESAITVQGIGALRLDSPREKLRAREKLRRYLKTLPGDQLAEALEGLRQKMAASSNGVHPRAFLTWEEVKEMQQHNISFGAHTHSHPILTRVPVDQARTEISAAKSEIEQALGQPVLTFAYPNGRSGDFNHQTRAILANQGFKAAVTLVHGSNAPQHTQNFDWLSLRRIYVGSDDRAVFIAKVSGALEKFYPMRFARKQMGAGG